MSIKPETLALRCLREVADEGDLNDLFTEGQYVITVYGEVKTVDRTGLLGEALRVADGYNDCHWEDVCADVRNGQKHYAKDELDECNRWGYRAHLLRKALGQNDSWQPSRLSHIA